MAWTNPLKKFNYRNTLGFVTDLSDETAVLLNGVPHTFSFVGQSDTVAAGFISVVGATATDRNATPTSGIEFAGTNNISNTNANSPATFRVELADANGTYQVSIAMGSYTGSQNQFYDIWDGDPTGTGTKIAGPFAAVVTTANQFADANGAVINAPASYAAWVSSTFVLQHVFTDTSGTGGVSRMYIRIGDPAKAGTGTSTIAHLRVVQGAAAGPSNQLIYSQRKVLYFI